jgi:hypothetical protein
MTITMVFTILGDTNIRRNVTSLNMESRELLKGSQVVDFKKFSEFESSVASIRAESTVCLIAGLTEALSSLSDAGSVLSTIDTPLSDFRDQLRGFASSRTGLHFIVAPSLYQESPRWYRTGLSAIARRLSDCLSESKPANVHLLPSFSSQDFLPDGKNLSPGNFSYAWTSIRFISLRD